MDYAQLNKKYEAFYVVGFSRKTSKYISAARPHPTFEAAMTAALRLERTSPKWKGQMLFVDIVAPK